MNKEKQIEERLIEQLKDLKYIYRDDIRDRNSLERNFRQKFETLNRVHLTDSEFERLLEDIINPDVFVSSKKLRERNFFQREDGTPLNYTLVNIKDWCKNEYEVINQLRINTDNSHHRYDVILLINGIPVAQIELKALKVSSRRAMQQIVDYKNESGNGYTNTLLCFMQLFIVSNQTTTCYFANNQNRHLNFNADEQYLPVYYLTDKDNKKISHLDDFTEKFLAKCTLGEMINRYMVLVAGEQKLLVMRPYQIYAVKAIVDCIRQNRGNGYIWHTTGSGKTLTSFKAATLLKDNHDIEKCLFVVDRKDLDKQTREEFNKFQEGCVEENTNTESLVQRMLSDDYTDKIIVTTIQKLGIALDLDPRNRRHYQERLKPLKNKRIVFIFDECHRSQFGDNHQAIKEFFPNAQFFGFTGTPIFEDNSTQPIREGEQASYKTTKDVFQNQLHAYTITHAIEDKNVLRFHIDYFKPKGNYRSKQAIIESILNKHDAATASRHFNAIMATQSINDAIEYYNLFKEIQARKQAENEDFVPLNIACIFSPPAQALTEEDEAGNNNNIADIKQLQEDLLQEKEDNKQDPEEKKKALAAIVKDYNRQYGTNHTTNVFDVYYQDVQQRIKDQKYSNADHPHKNKIDIVIVVDMLLTGFDSKFLNTLYVDKNLKYHGLIQAFSRTNRVLNDSKPYGNILEFRQQQDAVDTAIKLFSGEKDKNCAKEIWLVAPADEVAKKYEDAVAALKEGMQSRGLACKPEEVSNLRGDEARSEFINLFKEVQRYKTQLDQYTDLSEGLSEKIEKLIPKEQLQAFRGAYLETAKRLKALQDRGGEDLNPAVELLDFEFVLFSSAIIDYDYIMRLISQFTQKKPSKQKMTRRQLINLLSSSANLMDERDDIAAYINTLEEGKGLSEQEIREGYQTFKAERLAQEVAEMAQKYELQTDTLKTFVDNIMSRMIFDGEQLSDLFEPLELGWKERSTKELALMEDLVPLLKRLSHGREISGLKAYE
jgi:type I restriction enzyme R subunit